MSEERIESAVQRIETALARIAEIADAPPPEGASGDGPADSNSASVMALVEKHQTLQETVSDTLEEMDKLIGELEQ